MTNDDHLDRAAFAASLAVVDRFRALLEGRDDGADPLLSLVRVADRPRVDAGDVLQSYRLVRELGSGGSGVVFLAERADGQFVKNVAIKVLRGVATADGVRRLRAERQILAELDNPNIARLLDGGETNDGQPYLVLEYIEGDTLYAAVAKHAADLTARVALFTDIARAVAHAHQRLVVHRDLKPSNILVTAEWSPRLLDFGVARLLAHAVADDSTRVFTAGYASPEQRNGGRVTTRTDVFALGIILRELVTGLRVDGAAITPPLPPVSADADLIAIAHKASAADAEDRYPTVDALLDDLERWRRRLPVRARTTTLLYRGTRFVRRNRVGVLLTVVAVAATAAFVTRIQREGARARTAEIAALAAKQEAQRDAQRARQLVAFVSLAFDAASPENARGSAASVRELVAEAESSLEGGATAPEDRPALLLMLADLATRLGETDRALRLSARAVDTLPAVTAANREDAARAYALRTSALVEAGENEAALVAARQAEELAAHLPPSAIETRALTSYHLGLALAVNADAAARPVLERVIADTQQPVLDRLRASRALVDLTLQLEDADGALRELERARAIAAALPEKHPLRLRDAHLEAWARSLKNDWDAALVILTRAITERERDFGKHGAYVARLYSELSTLQGDRGHFKEAVAAIEESLALFAEVNDTGTNASIALVNAGSAYESIGDYPRAVSVMRRALTAAAGAPAPARRQFESNLARALALDGHVDEARATLARLLDDAVRETPGSFEHAREAMRLAQVETWAGHATEARAAYARGGEAFANLSQFMTVNLGRIDADIALLEGHLDVARARLAALESVALSTWGKSSFDTACLMVQLADVMARLGERKHAGAMLEASLPVMRRGVLPTERNRARAEALALRFHL